jgi:hypothetical protein
MGDFKVLKVTNINKLTDFLTPLFIIISILFVIYSYLPTLTQDYAAEDQLRAFNYSITTAEPSSKAHECYQRLTPFFTRTGRPLTWIGECIEHSLVNNVSDFRALRYFNIILVLITLLITSYAIFIYTKKASIAFISATLFVLLPGYCFMYYQGLTAMMVIVAPIISIFALIFVDFGQRPISLNKTRYLSFCILIILACCMYAAWSFVSLSLVVAILLIDFRIQIKDKFLILFRVVFAQLIASVAYFVLIKVMIKSNFWGAAILKNVEQYEFTLNNFLPLLTLKLTLLYEKLLTLPLFNTDLLPGVYSFILLLTYLLFFIHTYFKHPFIKSLHFASIITFLILSLALLIGSVSPWLVSGKTEITNMSYLLPLGLFFAIVFSGCIYNITNIIMPKHAQLFMSILALALMGLFSVKQHTISEFEVDTNNDELNLVRHEINLWVNNFSITQNKLILLIHPHKIRSSKIENLNFNSSGIDINLRLLTASEPIDSSRWLINAVLREQKNLPEIITEGLYDCGFDKSCANLISESNKIGILHTYPENFPESLATDPYVINLTTVTNEKFHPKLISNEKITLPKISATSQYDIFGPERINTQLTPAWYSEINPKFPQVLVLDLRQSKIIAGINLGAETNYPTRFPSYIDVSTSSDGDNWIFNKSFGDLCNNDNNDLKLRLILSPKVDARYIKLSVKSNCGDNSLISLRQLTVD